MTTLGNLRIWLSRPRYSIAHVALVATVVAALSDMLQAAMIASLRKKLVKAQHGVYPEALFC
jgi:hypothetical protein